MVFQRFFLFWTFAGLDCFLLEDDFSFWWLVFFGNVVCSNAISSESRLLIFWRVGRTWIKIWPQVDQPSLQLTGLFTTIWWASSGRKFHVSFEWCRSRCALERKPSTHWEGVTCNFKPGRNMEKPEKNEDLPLKRSKCMPQTPRMCCDKPIKKDLWQGPSTLVWLKKMEFLAFSGVSH